MNKAPDKLRTFLQEWPKPYTVDLYCAYRQPPWYWLSWTGIYRNGSILRLPLAWQDAWTGLYYDWDQPIDTPPPVLAKSQAQKLLASVSFSSRPVFASRLARSGRILRFTDRYGLWLCALSIFQRIGECRLFDNCWDNTSMVLNYGSPLPELAEVLGDGEWQLSWDSECEYLYCWQHQPSGVRFYPNTDYHSGGNPRWVPGKLLHQRRWYGSFGRVREMHYLLQQRRACNGDFRRMVFRLDEKQWTIQLGQRNIRTLALPATTSNTNADYETLWLSRNLVERVLAQLHRLPASETVYWYLVDEFGNSPDRTNYLLVTWLPTLQQYHVWD